MTALRVGTTRGGKAFTLPDSIVTATMAILAKKGAGKRLAIDTPLPTPSGWTTMGDVKVGDRVFGDDGAPCTVTYVSPIASGDTYVVRFSDRSEIVADAEHLWLTKTLLGRLSRANHARIPNPNPEWTKRPQCQRTREEESLVTTAQMGETIMHGRARNHAIEAANALVIPAVDLPIEPYLLGVWLGDGTAANGYITIGPGGEEMVGVLTDAGHTVSHVGKAEYIIRVDGLHRSLRENQLLDDKRIPEPYLRGSIEQRLALLQGLLDTDGGWNKSQVQFTNKNEGIARGVYELVVSLGMQARWSEGRAKLNGRDYGTKYLVVFSPTLQVFRLPRKAAQWRTDSAQQQRRRRRYVVAIESRPSVPMRCIAVDSPRHLFLAGRAMIPTHNTYTAGVIEEEFAQHHIPFVVLDPIGVHYGLRSTADGKAAGYPVVVFGGLHADVPLHQKMGTDLAKTIATDNISAIIDLSELSKTAWREFVRDFCRALFTHNRTPRHVFIEEATEFVPQRQMTPGMQETYEAVERMVRLGRNRGIGVTLIAQRSAQVAKDCLSQIDVLIAMRHTGKHDRDAIIDAIKDDLDDEQLARDLPAFRQGVTSLDDGEAWVWWPKNGIFEQIKVRQRVTFHGGATPVMGKKQAQPVMATPDLDKLRDRFKAIIEQREADDPKKLRAEIARLKLEHAKATVHVSAPPVDCGHLEDMTTMSRTIERQHDLLVKVGGEIAEDLGHIGTGQQRLRTLLTTLEQWSSGEQVETFKRVVKSATILPKRPIEPQLIDTPEKAAQVAERVVRNTEQQVRRRDGTIALVEVTGPQQKILDAILAFEVLGLAEVPRPVVAAHARVRHTTGTFKNNISRLNVSGLIGKRGANLVLTDAGRELANVATVPLTLAAFHEAWRSLLTGPQAAMLDQIIATHPDGIEREEIAAALDVKATTGTFKNNVSKLNVLGLIAKEGSALTATDLLFPAGLAR